MYSLKAWIPPGDTKSLIHDRDPKRVNKSLKVMFEDVIAEPPLVWSLDKVWLPSHALLDAPRPVSLAAGLLFTALSCLYIWKDCCYTEVRLTYRQG
uniref:Caveolin n=1 Tax=Seriola lalandi dorsalis TaxID=1841481 RepID=A0A3B4Z7Z3_SERLL